MGMLVTLYLILINTYNSVEAPSGRGFSYIDIWFVGCQVPIAFAILEYGLILAYKKLFSDAIKANSIKNLDYYSLILTLCYFLVFNALFWPFTQ